MTSEESSKDFCKNPQVLHSTLLCKASQYHCQLYGLAEMATYMCLPPLYLNFHAFNFLAISDVLSLLSRRELAWPLDWHQGGRTLAPWMQPLMRVVVDLALLWQGVQWRTQISTSLTMNFEMVHLLIIILLLTN